MSSHLDPQLRIPAHRARRVAAAIAAAIALVALAAISAPPAAEAAVLGPGYEYHGQAGSHLGGYLDPDGTISYCINAGAPSTVGKTTTDAGVVGSVNGLAPSTMVQLNELLSAHGNTADNNTAAAVAMAVWSIAGPADYDAEGGDRYVLGRAPASERAAIQALADRFRVEANTFATPTGSATLSLATDPTNSFLGTLSVSAPSATGTVTLTNAVFADSGTAVRSGVGDGAQLAIRATPPPASTDASSGQLSPAYRVSASADFTGQQSPEANVHLYTTPGSQTLTASGTSAPIRFSATTADTADRRVPTATTTAQETALVGETVVDTAHVVDVPSSGEQLTWAGYLQKTDTPTCTEKTKVFASSSAVTATADGDVLSESFPVTSAEIGEIFWIFTVRVDGEIVSTGTCGDETEISVLSSAPVSVQPEAVYLPVVSG